MKSEKLCECGCGEYTDVCERSSISRGWVKGEPKRFINHHALRLLDKPIKYKINKETGCWEWLLYIRKDGYGQLKANNITQLAHRWMYQEHCGIILEGHEYIDHLCRNRKCVNPVHLEVVTFTENIRRGSWTKINMDIALKIRTAYANKEGSQHQLARKFGISRSLISSVLREITWRIDESSKLSNRSPLTK